MNFWFRFRIPVSLAHAVLVTALLVWGASRQYVNETPSLTAPITLTLVASESEPAPVPTPVVPPVPPFVRPAFVPVPAVRPRSDVSTTLLATNVPVPMASSSSKGTAEAPPSAPAESAVSQPARVDEEAAYTAAIRAHLQKIKRYPTGREASQDRPAGTTRVRFILRRDGSLVEAAVDSSSGSMLLDNAALVTVRRGSYPPFPEPIWVGKSQQIFSVILEFTPSN